MKNLLKNHKSALGIIGCGAQSRYILDILKHIKFKGRIYIVDTIGKGPLRVYGLKVFRISKTEDIKEFFKRKKVRFFHIAVSDPVAKMRFIKIFSKDFKSPVLMHPSAIISSSAKIDYGCLINPFVYIGPNTIIEKGCFIHSFVNIDHDCHIGECVNIAPGAVLAGRVKIGHATSVYTQATIIPDIKIGNYATIGAGAIVLKNIPDKHIVAGNPAKRIKNDKKK